MRRPGLGSWIAFFGDALATLVRGGPLYWTWVGLLAAIAAVGGAAWWYQLQEGLVVTGMSDQVSWGIYIADFTFLVGLAAAAVMLVIPAYVFENRAAKTVVLLGEGMAAAACVMALAFVTVDLGRPDRLWHMLPGIGRFNWPVSLLTWDVIVLNVYLALNLAIPVYFLHRKYVGARPNFRAYYPWIVLSIFWAISIHTVTAFLYSANAGRPFWHTALLGPRFIASAFTSGPATMILAFMAIDRFTIFPVDRAAIRLLGIVTTVALQVNLFMLGAELFTEFYANTAHAKAAEYLFLGLDGLGALVPWIWTAIALQLVAVGVLMIHPLRERDAILAGACLAAIVGIWIEKGMGLIVPGFIPTPLGELVEYTPTRTELLVSAGIWALGLLCFTALAKAAIPIETGRLRWRGDTARL